MTKIETIQFIKDTYHLFRDQYKYTKNEFCELKGMDRRNFCIIIKPDYNRGLNQLRMARRLCHLLRDVKFRDHAVEWLTEVRNREALENWHGKHYTTQVRRQEVDGHADRKGAKLV